MKSKAVSHEDKLEAIGKALRVLKSLGAGTAIEDIARRTVHELKSYSLKSMKSFIISLSDEDREKVGLPPKTENGGRKKKSNTPA